MIRNQGTIKSERFPIVRILLVSMLLCWYGAFSVYPADAIESAGGSDSVALLLSESIAYASQEELQSMCALRGLDVSGTVDQLRERLFSYHGFASQELSLSEDDGSLSGQADQESAYDLEIIDAQRMMSAGSDSDLVVLEGNVTVRFTPGNGDGATKELTAGRMTIDLANSRLTAMGHVSFKDSSESSAVQEVNGDIVSLEWKSGNISVSGGTLTTSRTNSEDEAVDFFTRGTQIDYRGSSGGVQIREGYVTTNPDTAYSSITARSMAILPDGDMFVDNAYLSIGRVPVLWVPFFFYPGSTMVFNPAFGFASDRGMFLSTTYEVYGSYPKIKASDQSSFSSLLSTKTDGPRAKSGLIYTAASSDGTEDGLASWADETGSYLALMADAYQNAGVFVGFDSSTALLKKKIVIDAGGGVAFSPGTTTSSGYYHPTFRYLGSLSTDIDTDIVDFSLSMPLYSDPGVMRIYGNRLTSFSLDALFGSSQEFPTDYRSDITSYTWKAGGKFTFPKGVASPYITKLEISKLDAIATFQWDSSSTNSYKISSLTLPNLTAAMAGTLFSVKKEASARVTSKARAGSDLEIELERIRQSAGSESEDVAVGDVSASVSNDEQTTDEQTTDEQTTDEQTTDEILPDMYRAESVSDRSAKSASTGMHLLSLGYTLDQTLKNQYASSTDENNMLGPQTLYAATKGSLILEGSIAPYWFKFSQKLAPALTISEEEDNDNYASTQLQLTSSTVAEIPLLGLKYTLVTKLYNYKKVERDSVDPEIIEQWASWDSDFVTTHQLALTKSFDTSAGTFTASLTGTLPPLRFSLLPALAWRYGGWRTNFSFKFVDDGNGNLQKDLITAVIGYEQGMISTSFTGTYQTASYDPDGSFWAPFTLNGYFALKAFGNRLEAKQSIDFVATSTSGDNYFNSLVSSVAFKRNPKDTSSIAKLSFTFEGPAASLSLSSFDLETNIDGLTFSWWKRRIKLGFSLSSDLYFDFQDRYSSSLSLTAKVNFSIAEFLSLSIGLTSTNNGFFSYYDGDTFSWQAMFEDLMRSVDFFGTGRTHTQFNMEDVSVELIHYMKDWDLHCKYTGSVVLSGHDWQWVPKVTIFLQWNTIPELKVDETWTRQDDVWSQGT